MPRPKDKKYLTTENQEHIDALKLARKSFRLNNKNSRKIGRRQTLSKFELSIKPQNRKGTFTQKRLAASNALDSLQTRTSTNGKTKILPKNLIGLGGGGRRSRKVMRDAIKDVKYFAKEAGPIKDRGVIEDGDTVSFKEGGTKKKKKKALKKATAMYKSGGFLEPPTEEI